MIQSVEISPGPKLKDYEAYASLFPTVKQFLKDVEPVVKKLKGRKVCMVNSTAKGGGVAEMLPPYLRICRQLGLSFDWVVMQTDEADFFRITKNIHNLIHGKGDPNLTAADRELYEKVNKENAMSMMDSVHDGDIIIIHDPQPMGMAKYLKAEKDIKLVWRCHIGLDEDTTNTDAAWDFLKPYTEYFDHFVFTAPEYIPPYMKENCSIIPPGIDPLSHKNRNLDIHKVSGILSSAGVIKNGHPNIGKPFIATAQRVLHDGSFGSPINNEDIGMLFRPTMTQVSRWDRLKGFVPLMKGFIHLKKDIDKFGQSSELHRRRLEAVRLILAGPDPASVSDDPEGKEVLEEMIDVYKSLPANMAEDIAILMLPMNSTKENALIVNALQRCSSIVIQNSIQEGFGLTATEAMWKRTPVMTSSACGLRLQVRDRQDGRLLDDPTSELEIARLMNYMLEMDKTREIWGYSAQNQVINNFLIFSLIRRWFVVFENVIK